MNSKLFWSNRNDAHARIILTVMWNRLAMKCSWVWVQKVVSKCGKLELGFLQSLLEIFKNINV